MRVVSQLTGLSADTVRVWERRHTAILPARTAGNARRYTEADIRRLVLLRTAIAHGHSIGEIAGLRDEALAALTTTRSVVVPVDPMEWARSELLDAVKKLDGAAAAASLALAAARLSPRSLALEFVAPLMREVGELWHAGALTVAQEHFATNQVRSLLFGCLRVSELPEGAPRIVLAAPEGHLHDVGLVVASLLATTRGVRPVLLGADLPLAELGGAARRAKAAVTIVAVARDLRDDERRSVLARLGALALETELWIGAPEGHPVLAVPGARALTSLADCDAAIAGRFPGAIAPR